MTDARPMPSPAPSPLGQGPAPAAWRPARPAGVPGLRGTREDLRSALLTVLALAFSGLAAGGVWIWLAPRADYRVTATGVEPIGTAPSPELFMADDGVFVLVLAALGLLAGVVVWLRRRRRGALTLVALATGMLAAGVVAWRLGDRVGAGPTDAQLADVGARVTTALGLGATAALAVGPFVAVLTYLAATAVTHRDDLGRDDLGSDDLGSDAPGRDDPGRDDPGRDDPVPAEEPLRPPLPPVPPPARRP